MRGNNLPRAAMLIFVRIHILLLLLFVVSSFSMGFVQAGINEDLEAIDAVIQTNKTPVRVAGEPAYNVFQGATAVLLGQKKDIMVAAGFVFFKVSDTYSFTSTPLYSDTKFTVTTLSSSLRLYRRGNGATSEIARGYFGSWWGDKYRGIQSSRDEQAILAVWGSDLNRIYVVDVQAGNMLAGGLAAPMEKDGEYRAGGAYQYYFSSALRSWLVYALYAPDYLKSYSGAVTSAQQTGRSVANDLGLHLNQTRYAGIPFTGEGEFWLRGFAGNSNFAESDSSAVSSQTGGLSLGWQRLTGGGKPADKSRAYFGLMAARASNLQKYASNVENRTQAIVGGIYGLYVNRPDSARSWYGHWSLLHGGLTFNNTVPGELGYGLKQEYNGNITVLTLENGVSFRQKHGWALEPQLQLSYTKVGQNDFTDKLGAPVSLKQGESLQGRLGLSARRTIGHSSQRQSSYWAKLSYIHNFSGRNEVDIAGDRAVSEANRNSCQLGLGADLQLNRQWSLQGEVAQLFGGETGFQGNLALKLAW